MKLFGKGPPRTAPPRRREAQPSVPAAPAPSPERTPLAIADRAEAAGDPVAAVAGLRAHLAHRPGDRAAHMRLARLLLACGEPDAARTEAARLIDDEDAAAAANALLAEIDEIDGQGATAAVRWERVLAHDVDHPRARGRLRALRPAEADPAAGTDAMQATFHSPDGQQALRYHLLRELGRGATAAVYLARDQSLDLHVALKVLHPHLATPARSDGRRRFFAEARTAAALRHPGVVAIYDLDEVTRTLAMEYVAGGTLRARVRPHGRDVAETLQTARSLLGTLAYVHEHGIVHGDLKPGNLLLRRPGVVVLADFGIAHLAEEVSAEAPAGTPLYLAPEQLRGAPSSPFTDLYAAGAILWEMLAGRPMREHADLVKRSPTAPLLPAAVLSALGSEGEALSELIARLVEANPAARLPSAGVALRFL